MTAQYLWEAANHMRGNQASRPGFLGQWPDRVGASRSRVNILSYFGHLKIENTHTRIPKEAHTHLHFIFLNPSGFRTLRNTVTLFSCCKNKTYFHSDSYQSQNQYNPIFAVEWELSLSGSGLDHSQQQYRQYNCKLNSIVFLLPVSIRPNLLGSCSSGWLYQRLRRERRGLNWQRTQTTRKTLKGFSFKASLDRWGQHPLH